MLLTYSGIPLNVEIYLKIEFPDFLLMCGWFLIPSGQFGIVCEIQAVYYPIWITII
jgi:hypothetical protein